MNGTGLTLGSAAGSEAGGGGSIMGAEAGVHHNLAEVWGLWKVIEGGLMRRSWVDGSEERMWKPSLRIRLSQCRPE